MREFATAAICLFALFPAQEAFVSTARAAQTSGATAVSKDCSARRMSLTASDAEGTSTKSTVPIDLVEGAVHFKQGGSKPDCAIVEFSAYSYGVAGEIVMVRALLDGAVMFPGEIQFSGSDNQYASAHAFSWAGNVKPGRHTVQMQFRSFFGNTAIIQRHSTGVLHR